MTPSYLIDVPPPTISGLLHMGHVFSYAQMDFIARYQRFKLDDTQEILYPYCFDCNGIPTEKLAHKAGIKEQDKIIDHAIAASSAYRDLFTRMQMGYSNNQYHTFDTLSIEIAKLSFQDLLAKDLIYKAEAEYFWCPTAQISIPQAEIDENGCYERTGTRVEIKKGIGWFIRMKDQLPRIRKAIDAIEWHPDHFRHRLHRWLDDLQFDWSISRERTYGIQIPGETNQVFDTWFTSSLTPQLAWASHTKTASLECPIFDARFQAHDIIRTWALFTIIKSIYHNDQIPWKNIIISGHALDPQGHKISKQAGNFKPPHTYLDQYGTSAIRYWAAQTQYGKDTKIDFQAMDKGKKLINKIRNAYKFVIMRNDEIIADKGWNDEIMNAYKHFDNKMTEYLEAFKWAEAIKLLTDYFWHMFCDDYIERAKKECLSSTLGEIFQLLFGWFTIFIPDIHENLREIYLTSKNK